MVDDQWSSSEENLLSHRITEEIRRVLRDIGPLIVEHRLYRGSSGPRRLIFEEYEDFTEYMSKKAHPGDHFLLWNYSALCRGDNAQVRAKYPDPLGRIPLGGAY